MQKKNRKAGPVAEPVHRSNGKIDVPGLVNALFSRRKAVRIGVSYHDAVLHYAVVVIDRDGNAAMIGYGRKIPRLLRLLVPVAVYADTAGLPVYLQTADCGSEDPDNWIGRNANTVIPAGFAEENIVTEYAVNGTSLLAASAAACDAAAFITSLEKEVVPAALYMPLQGAARLYRGLAAEQFIIWKVNDSGSVLARVTDGVVTALCHFWAGREDVELHGSEVCAALLPLIGSMAEKNAAPGFLCIPEALPQQCRSMLEANGTVVIDVPQINGCPPEYHEAYGNALLHKENAVQILPFDKKKHAEKLQAICRAGMTGCMALVTAIIAFVIIGLGYSAASRMYRHHDRQVIEKVDRQHARVAAAAAKRDSLRNELAQKSAFIARESALTRLLADLQEVFPAGVKAEELTVAERDESSWRMTLLAYTKSSSLMQPFSGNLQKVRGITDTRIIYSEKIAGKNENDGIRFKIEAVWR